MVEMLLIWSFVIAHVVVKAVEETWDYTKAATSPTRTRAGEALNRKVRSEDWKLGPGTLRWWTWAAASLAWLTGKTIKHGVGTVRAIKKGAAEGRAKAKIKVAHRQAMKINRRLDWEELANGWKEEEDAPAGEPFFTPDRKAEPEPEVEEPPAPEAGPTPTAEPPPADGNHPGWILPDANDAEVTLERVDDTTGPLALTEPLPAPPELPAARESDGLPIASAPAPPDSTDIVDAVIVEDETAPAPAGNTPIGDIAMTDSIPSGEVRGLNGARQILAATSQLLLNEQSAAEARKADAEAAHQRLEQVSMVVGQVVDGLRGYQMDEATLNDAMGILDQVNAAAQAAQGGARCDSRAWEAMANAVTATTTTVDNMNARHRALEEAHANAPVRAGVRELYTDGQ